MGCSFSFFLINKIILPAFFIGLNANAFTKNPINFITVAALMHNSKKRRNNNWLPKKKLNLQLSSD